MSLYVWFTVGGLRSPSNRVPLWVIHAKTGGEPYGDTWSWAVSLGVFVESRRVVYVRMLVM